MKNSAYFKYESVLFAAGGGHWSIENGSSGVAGGMYEDEDLDTNDVLILTDEIVMISVGTNNLLDDTVIWIVEYDELNSWAQGE